MEPFIGSIYLFAAGFAPRGYAICNGQLLPINQNQALFSILGTTYGGNGTTNFALPDFRNRVPVSEGQRNGHPNYSLGERAGFPTHTLTTAEMPAHTHLVSAVTEAGNANLPTGAFFANTVAPDRDFATGGTATALNSGAISSVGNGNPFTVEKPYLGINYIIAIVGIFPPRS